MSREFPDWVNPRKAAEGRRIFKGTVPLARMARLAPLLAGSDGEAGFMAAFSLDSQGRMVIRIDVEADLPLTCQSTLETYWHAVARQTVLAVVEDEAEQESLPGDYEPTCTEAGRLNFAGLVEDELLLSLPQVPRKPGLEGRIFSTDPDAPTPVAPGEAEYRRPFAALKQLMREGHKGSNTK